MKVIALIPQQAAFDVTYYDLDLTIEPEEKTISGSLMVRARIVDDLDSLVLDLDDVFMVDSVLLDVNVPVSVNGSSDVVEMNAGQGSISLPLQAELIIDPEQWILMDTPVITTMQDRSSTGTPTDFQLYQNYPNPFNHETKIGFNLPVASNVELSVYNLRGEFLSVIFAGKKDSGIHWITWNAQNFSSGAYFIHLKTGNFTETIKTTLLK